MEALESVISLIITLGILVTIHEYGHFWVARRCGVKVLRFSVGFGKPIWTWTDKSGTEFAIASIPLGGYVRMLDEREGPVPDDQKHMSFNGKPVSQRIAIASAGPIANFLFAIAAYWLMFLLGFNALIPSIGSIDPDSEAAKAGLAPGLEIIAVDQQPTQSWRSVNMALVNRIGETGEIEVTTQYSPNSAAEKHSIAIDSWLVGEEQTDLIRSLGIEPKRPAIPAKVGQVVANSPAEQAGLRVGDVITQAESGEIQDWFSLVDIIKGSEGEPITMMIERDGQKLGSELRPEAYQTEDGSTSWKVGVGVAPFKYPDDMIRSISYGPIDSFGHALDRTWADTAMTLKAIKKMMIGLVSLDNLSGPITIAQVASQSISSGLEAFLSFLALLSVSLGVLNLLPIPVLDGGHILYYSIEALIGKPIPEKWQVIGLKIGVSFILLLMTVAFYNDIMRL